MIKTVKFLYRTPAHLSFFIRVMTVSLVFHLLLLREFLLCSNQHVKKMVIHDFKVVLF